MAGEPLVSVVIPTYNREPMLREAVESVFAQTYANWELIVVDDGSTDGTTAYLDALGPRARVIHQAHSGNPALLRNLGIGAATGQYVAFLDADDRWLPSKLELQVQALLTNPARQWGYTGLSRIDGAGRALPLLNGVMWHPRSGWILSNLLSIDAIVTTSGVIASRALLSAVGGFDESFVLTEDYELWIRLAIKSEASSLALPLVQIRVHPTSLTHRHPEIDHYWIRLYEKVLKMPEAKPAHALCRRLLVRSGVTAATRGRWTGHYALAWLALGQSFRYGVWEPRWWGALIKTLFRPVTPSFVLVAYRRAFGGPASAPAVLAPGGGKE